jgi:hypothetical protein
MAYTKHLSILRRRLRIKKVFINEDAFKFAGTLAERLGLRGFAQFTRNHFCIELEGNEVLIQEFVQSYIGRLALNGQDDVFDIETLSLAGEKTFTLKGIDSKK